MLVSRIKEEDLTIEVIDKLLFENIEDTSEAADCIIVLGSSKASMYRVPIAVEVYNSGRSNKILLCGGKLRDFSTGICSEAEHMKKATIALGIPAENIILENSSQNTVENLLCSLMELQRTFCLNNIHSVILVTTTYHMRRSLAIAQYLFPKHISIIPCPADDTNTRRDNWMNTSAGTERAKKEAMKIIKYVNNGVIPDFEV